MPLAASGEAYTAGDFAPSFSAGAEAPVRAAVRRGERGALPVADAHERQGASVAGERELVDDGAAQLAAGRTRFQCRPASTER